MNVSCPECGSVFRVDPAKVPQAGVRARCSICGGVIPIGKSGVIDEDFASPATAMAAVGAPSAASAPETSPPPPAPSAPPSTPAQGTPPPRTEPPRREPVASPFADTPVVSPRVDPAITPVVATPATPASPATPATPATPVAAAPAAAPPPARPIPTAPPRAPTPAASLPVTPVSTPAARSPAATSPAQTAARVPAARAPINPFLANDPNQKAKRLARALISDIIAYHPQKHGEALRNGTLKELFREEIKKSYEEYVDQMGREFAEATTHFQDALNDVLAGGRKVF